ncbi:RHS repeat-associated core domain-containing protein, partial [Parabacteroides distasonis]|uniref:RHS repeat-associated core domain-containing protein n=1 Tax=Parabacteroides distasonis TaxID=823 RepID=UPI00293F0D53
LLDVYGEVKECHGDRTLVPFRYQGQYEDIETRLYYNRFRYYSPQTGMYISSDPIGLAGNNPTLYGFVPDTNTWLDNYGLQPSSKDFNQARNEALKWLEERGFKAEKPTLGRFGDIAGKPIGMQTVDGKVGFRVEYDVRSGAHFNIWAGKEKGPHITFKDNEKTVKKIQGHYKCKG